MEVGDVNIAPDYFDEVKLSHFERLMVGQSVTVNRVQAGKRGTHGTRKRCNAHTTEMSGSDDDSDD